MVRVETRSLVLVGSDVRAAASPPTRSPAQYSPALMPGTTRFGMERGGIDIALGHAHIRPGQMHRTQAIEGTHAGVWCDDKTHQFRCAVPG
jgi:hypothetical protein